MQTQETDTTMCRPRAWTYEDQRFREREIGAQEVTDNNGPDEGDGATQRI